MEANLFGNPEVGMVKNDHKSKTRAERLLDYDAFEEKFKPKKTTDDCYTPPEVYDAVCEWVGTNITPLQGHRIVRPFKPGGDYQREVYLPGDIILDNPPFSILSQIRRYYATRGLKYFLFAPALTLFSGECAKNETFIIAYADIRYENGAEVKTSFITNLLEDGTKIWIAGDLSVQLTGISMQLRKTQTRKLPKYSYPPEVLSAAIDGKIASRGVSYKIGADECLRIAALDSQRSSGKAIFGNGYLLSEAATQRRAAAAAAAAADNEREWELSERERRIIQSLK